MKDKKRKHLCVPKFWKRGTAWLLVFSMLFQVLPVSAQELETGPSNVISVDGSTEKEADGELGETQENVLQEQTETIPEEESSAQKEEKVEEGTSSPEQMVEPENVAELYENGIIKIYNFHQLQAIGTGNPVRTSDREEETFGTGTEVVNEGKIITYASDATYMLMNEIPLPSGEMWTLPDEFTGTFSGTPSEDAALYNKERDTVYVYNNYQLRLIASENSAEEPILSNDMIPEKVGIGQLLYKDGTLAGESPKEAQEYLTYSKEHNYVLSSSFTEQMPELLSEQYVQTSADEVQKGGRDYIGQGYTTIEGEKYILIGNEQQLRAIGTDKSVTPMLFLRTEAKLLGIPLGHKIVPYYPGDADFNMNSFLDTGIDYKDIKKGSENFQYKQQNDEAKKKELMNIDWGSDTLLGEVVGIVGGLLGGILGELLGSKELVGLKVDGSTPSIGADDGGWLSGAEYTSFSDLEREYKDLKYSSDANYT